MNAHEKNVIIELGKGPRTVWWLDRALGTNQALFVVRTLIQKGFVEERGVEFLYPHVDRQTGKRKERGRKEYRFKGWTEVRTYYALTRLGRVLLPLDKIVLGEVKK